MPRHRVEAAAVIDAPAERIYTIIADYRDPHRRILPPKYFSWLRVEAGGVGAGTRIHFAMRVLGRSRTMRALITEPEPGRVLVETETRMEVDQRGSTQNRADQRPAVEGGIVTTFRLDPKNGARATRVTISTELDVRDGLAGALERFMTTRVFSAVYRQELQRLKEYAEGTLVHAPVPATPEA